MDPLITLITVFAIFIPALVLPGPDFVVVVRTSMTRGPIAGLMTTLGVSTGLVFYATLSLAGLSAILIEFQWLTWLVRVLGGAYLVYLGIRLVVSQPQTIDVSSQDQHRAGSAFVFGFLVTLTNPKAIVLFASVFATAVSESTPAWLMLVMIALVFVSSATWYAFVSVVMSSQPVIKRFATARHWIERAAGVCFVAIGGRIIADARNPIS